MADRTIDRRDFVHSLAAASAAIAVRPGIGRWLDQDPTGLTLAEAAAQIKANRVTPTALVQACLARIKQWQPHVNAFITITDERALAEAKIADGEISRGRYRGPLHGIPIALKDNIDTAGVRTTAASAVFADRVPSQDAEVVRRLKDAGAIVLGKLNMDEFANGGSSVKSYWGPVHNPWNLAHEAGGSSGGSAAAVAARLCFGALGTDTGGSIRVPSAHCGVTGMKPTYGRVSNRGVIPLCWSYDHTGPIARTVEDVSLLLQVIAGYDAADPASVNVPVPAYAPALTARTSDLRVGIPRNFFYDVLDSDVRSAVEAAVEAIRPMVKSIADVILPPVLDLQDAGSAEFYAVHKDILERAGGLYQPNTRKSLEGAAKVSGASYVLARRMLEERRKEVARVFETVDVLVTPTVKYAPKTIKYWQEQLEVEKPLPPMVWNTWIFNTFGLPAMSVPCGFTGTGLPIGAMFVGGPFGEEKVLALGSAYQRSTDWHRRQPELPPEADRPKN
jgi:aspartyl-tRNA(Asn)/glutamyl-tRNA(Gln) amidotransferase subunit A